jgi:biotin carboxyl carrier protein
MLTVSYARQRDGTFAVEVTGEGLPGDVTAAMTVTVHHAGGGWIDFAVSVPEQTRQRHRRHVLRHGSQVWVQGPDGDVALAAVPRFPEAGPGQVAGGLLAPMPGSVLEVGVAPGDTVAAGQLLMIMEAMKMEHRVTAPHAGTVAAVHARPGDQVAAGDLLALIDPAGEAP